jgi:hypothetical protein
MVAGRLGGGGTRRSGGARRKRLDRDFAQAFARNGAVQARRGGFSERSGRKSLRSSARGRGDEPVQGAGGGPDGMSNLVHPCLLAPGAEPIRESSAIANPHPDSRNRRQNRGESPAPPLSRRPVAAR